MTLSRLLLLPVCLSALLLAGCPTNSSKDSFDYLRSPVTFRIDPVADNHPFCSDPSKRVGSSTEECQAIRKYRLVWERPEDTVGFSEYRIYVDTMPPPDAPGLSWTDIRKDPTRATFIVQGQAAASDSIIFVLTSGAGSPSGVTRGTTGIVKLDTTGRIDSLGKLVFAISTVYREAGRDGQPRYTWVITNDRFAPNPVQPSFIPHERSVDIAWSRPKDPTSFFDPAADSGIIKRYVLRVIRGGAAKASIPFHPIVTYYGVGGVDRTAEVVVDSFRTGRGAPGLHFFLPDSQRVINRLAEDMLDSLKLTLGNLTPQDTVNLSLWAVDMDKNATDSNSETTKFLTDTTEPTKPVVGLLAGSVTRNGFIYSFIASRDLVETGSGLAPAGTPNANILEYHLLRNRIGGSAGGTASVDSVFKISASQRGQETFTDTVRYLPPGAQYRVYVQSMDSSGHLSQMDSLTVSTLSANFTGGDTLATCPTGFIPIPSGSFQLGSTAGFAVDETPANTRKIGSYCIEPYEHRVGVTTGPFQTHVTWDQARDICAAESPGNGSHLCTEPEWERACEGIDSIPLVYGIQSETRDPAGIRYACNIGTNDSAMATTIKLRDPNCLSRDGVFDMAGNFAEWVLDPYTPLGYPGGNNDTVIVGQPLSANTSTSRHVFRGSHYLNPGLSPTLILASARCSNRDVPTQLRPRAYAGCTDSLNPKLVVIYSAPSLPRCFTLPDSLQHAAITSFQPARDTNQILIVIQNRATPAVFTMPIDTAYKGVKPLSAILAPRSLAVVTFENSETHVAIVDTLDATEMLTASQAGLDAIFAREAASPWSAHKVNGQYAIQYLYSYSYSQGTQARAYYSNKIIGFRCCSNPVPAPAGKRAAAKKR